MPDVVIDGIATHYEVLGSGPALLMFSPGGFEASLDKWRTQGIYPGLQLLDRLPEHYTTVVFDRRESGLSGGRVEHLGWRHYSTQAKGLLDHLGFDRAHLMGGCMGCSPALNLAVEHPEVVESMILFWPVGGARYRIRGSARFAAHLAYVQAHGMTGVSDLIESGEALFGKDPRVGPWASVVRRDAGFRDAYRAIDPDEYALLVEGIARTLIDRDTSPGAEPEDLLRSRIPALVIPGQDSSHPTSAARYLQECLPRSEYWDVPVAEQTSDAVNGRILAFLAAHDE